METNRLISLKAHKNYNATIYSSVVLILFIITYVLMIKNFINTDGISTFNDIDIIQILANALWVLIIISIVWSYKIAKQTGREPGLWIFLGFITGPIALLIISLKDYNIENPELETAIKITRKEFKDELNKEKRNNPDTEIKDKLEEKYNQRLNERAVDIITKDKVGTLQNLVDNGVIDKNTDIKEKERLIKFIEQNKFKDTEVENWSLEWVDDESVCPACGTPLDKSSNNCLNCGLRIK